MKKDWILTIGVDKFYLTEKQVNFYLAAIDKGAKYVAVDEHKMLGVNFQSLVHVSVKEETKKMEQGKWKCEFGTWHNKEATCFCNHEFETIGDTFRLKDK